MNFFLRFKCLRRELGISDLSLSSIKNYLLRNSKRKSFLLRFLYIFFYRFKLNCSPWKLEMVVVINELNKNTLRKKKLSRIFSNRSKINLILINKFYVLKRVKTSKYSNFSGLNLFNFCS